jgi:hypothetical protein
MLLFLAGVVPAFAAVALSAIGSCGGHAILWSRLAPHVRSRLRSVALNPLAGLRGEA